MWFGKQTNIVLATKSKLNCLPSMFFGMHNGILDWSTHRWLYNVNDSKSINGRILTRLTLFCLLNLPGFNAELKYPIQKTIVTKTRGVAQASPHIDEILYLVCDRKKQQQKKQNCKKNSFFAINNSSWIEFFLFCHLDHIFFQNQLFRYANSMFSKNLIAIIKLPFNCQINNVRYRNVG